MKIRYFAWVRERTGTGEETVSPPDDVETVADLIQWLSARGPEFAHAFEKPDIIRAAINEKHVTHDASISDAQEIALFPPVTGG